MAVLVLLLLTRLMLGIVDSVIRGSRIVAFLGNLVEDAGLGFFLGGVVGHGESDCRRSSRGPSSGGGVDFQSNLGKSVLYEVK